MSIQINGIFPGRLSPDKVFGGCIEIFKDVWPNPEKTIEEVESQCRNYESPMNWIRAKTIDDFRKEDRTNYVLGITSTAQNYSDPLAETIHNQMNFLLMSSTIPYAEKYGIQELYHEPYDLLKYKGGQEYKQHYDGPTVTGRSISAICYLNNNFSGGEIEFVNFNVKIKPEPGMLILFPSNYAYSHIAHPVTSGQKYALVTWIKDRYIGE